MDKLRTIDIFSKIAWMLIILSGISIALSSYFGGNVSTSNTIGEQTRLIFSDVLIPGITVLLLRNQVQLVKEIYRRDGEERSVKEALESGLKVVEYLKLTLKSYPNGSDITENVEKVYEQYSRTYSLPNKLRLENNGHGKALAQFVLLYKKLVYLECSSFPESDSMRNDLIVIAGSECGIGYLRSFEKYQSIAEREYNYGYNFFQWK